MPQLKSTGAVAQLHLLVVSMGTFPCQSLSTMLLMLLCARLSRDFLKKLGSSGTPPANVRSLCDTCCGRSVIPHSLILARWFYVLWFRGLGKKRKRGETQRGQNWLLNNMMLRLWTQEQKTEDFKPSKLKLAHGLLGLRTEKIVFTYFSINRLFLAAPTINPIFFSYSLGSIARRNWILFCPPIFPLQ